MKLSLCYGQEICHAGWENEIMDYTWYKEVGL